MVAVPGGGFNIGYGYIKSRTPAKEKERREVLGKFFTPQPGEKPMQVAGRVEAFFRGAGSTTELVEAIKGGAELAKLAKEGGAA